MNTVGRGLCVRRTKLIQKTSSLTSTPFCISPAKIIPDTIPPYGRIPASLQADFAGRIAGKHVSDWFRCGCDSVTELLASSEPCRRCFIKYRPSHSIWIWNFVRILSQASDMTCVQWQHMPSLTEAVTDCYRAEAGKMIIATTRRVCTWTRVA